MPSIWEFSDKEVILYALSLGCSREETRFVYENDETFAALPTFGVLPLHNGALDTIDFADLIPNFNPMKVLHGEQFLELKQPIPAAGKLQTRTRMIDLIDKGKAAVAIIGMTTCDADTGDVILENETTIFFRGAGGFGKKPAKPRNPEAVALHEAPNREPDCTIREQTSENQAALYRLNGDRNPLHIDQEFASMGGFPKPILHGLCTFGISAKHVMNAYGQGVPASVKSIKGRFAKHVFPGESLETEMWHTAADTVVFRTKVVERQEVAISNAAVVFNPGALRQSRASRL